MISSATTTTTLMTFLIDPTSKPDDNNNNTSISLTHHFHLVLKEFLLFIKAKHWISDI